MGDINSNLTVILHDASCSRIIKKNSLPKSPSKKRVVVKSLFEEKISLTPKKK